MKAILICPDERKEVATFADSAPLPNLPILGKALIEYWLEHLALSGVKEACVLATDRPEQVRELIGDGARWGLRVEVFPELRELTPDEAREKYRAGDDTSWLPAPDDTQLMDHLPALPEFPLFTSYADWFAAVQAWMPRAATPDRVGVREIQPGVWVSLHARVSPDAELRGPCWIGENVWVGPGAVVGPAAILENKGLIERGATIANSVVGPETFVGEFTELRDSVAFGGTLVNWRLNSSIMVTDAHLLCSLAPRPPAFASVGLLSRLAAAFTMLLLLPLALLPILRARLRGRPALRPQLAVYPRASDTISMPGDTLIYYELTGVRGWLRRWPQFWSIVRGKFAWVGNHPLNPSQAVRLASGFERLWLAAPIGLISLADAEACREFLGDEARAHAAYYAAEASWRLDWAIFSRALFRFAFGVSFRELRERFVELVHLLRATDSQAH